MSDKPEMMRLNTFRDLAMTKRRSGLDRQKREPEPVVEPSGDLLTERLLCERCGTTRLSTLEWSEGEEDEHRPGEFINRGWFTKTRAYRYPDHYPDPDSLVHTKCRGWGHAWVPEDA